MSANIVKCMIFAYNKYKVVLLKIKRGNNRGIFSNAKPILVASLIEAINEGVILDNKIPFNCDGLKTIYERNFSNDCFLEQKLIRIKAITPYRMPYFHLNAESFYHLKWNNLDEIPKQKSSPSSKFLQTYVEYAYLDDALWELLQDTEVCKDFSNAIINHYLT